MATKAISKIKLEEARKILRAVEAQKQNKQVKNKGVQEKAIQ